MKEIPLKHIDRVNIKKVDSLDSRMKTTIQGKINKTEAQNLPVTRLGN